MKKSPGIVVLSVLLVLLGIQLLRHLPSRSTGSTWLVLTAAYLALAVLSMLTARSLWRGSAHALRLFGVWAVSYLAVGGLVEVVCAASPFVEVVMWWALVGAILFAVGLHLRHVLRQAA
ncbi:MAG TPA: hypothetical protein VJ826_11665 [Candidatus Polarisedimenticolaceae bacterium]|nr:hypothetical protein [Candidatus Polarisedimenticolaceae bacterium]